MVKLVEICETKALTSGQQYTLREVYVNPKHVVALREESTLKKKLVEGLLPENLDERQQFTRLTLDRGQVGLDLVVVGGPGLVESKLKDAGERHVLRD